MYMRYDFTRSSIYSILSHYNILNERNLIKILRHPHTHSVCEIIRLLASYDVLTLTNPQAMIDFILSHHHLTPYLAAIKTLITYKLLAKEQVALISQNEDAYILTEAILILKKYSLYSSIHLTNVFQHPKQKELLNLWTLLDVVEYFNLQVFQLTLAYANPQILLDSLYLFQKMDLLNQKILNRFFYCLQQNPEKHPQLITHNFFERQKLKSSFAFKPKLAIIIEDEEEDGQLPESFKVNCIEKK
jgi:hypothetical protein